MKGDRAHDVAIIGAGVVGLFIAYHLSKYDVDVVMVEKEAEPGFGVSKGHAGVLHVVQLPLKSTKSALCLQGNRMYDAVAAELKVKLWRLPALLVARSFGQLLIMPLIYAVLRLYYGAKGFDVSVVNGAELRALEPNVIGYAAIRISGYGVIDSFDLVYKLHDVSRSRGVKFLFNTEVVGIEIEPDCVVLRTNRGPVKSKFLVNAAGLESDRIANLSGAEESLVTKRGAMLVFEGLQVRSVVAPLQLVRGGETKGGGIIPTVWGRTIWGPNLARGGSRDDKGVYPEDVEVLTARFGGIVRSRGRLLKAYAGVRPSHVRGDFVIAYSPKTFRIVNLVGVESPGFTAAPAIAVIVLNMLKRAGLDLELKTGLRDPEFPRKTRELLQVDPTAVKGPRGIVVCPCMSVSLADIEEAVRAGSRTLDGVMFRTGLGMGSCQGQHCLGRAIIEVLRLTGLNPEALVKGSEGSWLVERS